MPQPMPVLAVPVSDARAKYARLVETRMASVLHELRVLEQMADRLRYTAATDADVESVVCRLQDAVAEACAKFRAGTHKPVFRLPG